MTDEQLLAQYKDILDNDGLILDYSGVNYNNFEFDADKVNNFEQRNKSYSETNTYYTSKEKSQVKDQLKKLLPNILTAKQLEWYNLAYNTETHYKTNTKITVNHTLISQEMNITKKTSHLYRSTVDKIITNTSNMTIKRLTNKQQELINLLEDNKSIKQITVILNISKQAISKRIKRLKDNNLI